MKRISTLFAILLAYTLATAQTPQLINYQAVARNAQGAVLANQPIGVRIIVHDLTPSGTSLYSETHTDTTNQFGLFTLKIGNGGNQTGTLAAVDWSTNAKFLEVDLDPTGGTTYSITSSSQLLSVPYALYAQSTAGIAGTANYVAKFATANTVGNSQIFDNGTNVGIGTVSPTAHLHVFAVGDTTTPNLLVEQNSADPSIFRITNNVANSYWDLRSDGYYLNVYSKALGANTMQFAANGQVQVGTPGGGLNCKLWVNSSNYIGMDVDNRASTGTGYGIVGSVSTNGSGSSTLYGVDGEAIGGSTDICYGIYGEYYGGSASSYAGYFSGSVYTSGTYQPSDEKLKRNIGEINSPLSTVMALHPASYQYKTDEYKHMNLPEGNQYGFIAAELEKVIPTAVRQTTQPARMDHATQKELTPAVKFKAVNYNQIIPLLVGGMQEQNQSISELKALVKQLQQQNESLQQQLKGLTK